MIKNHYGYGLRNDEKPYAHKIPPGGNWRDLPIEEQKAFMKGSYGNGGGNSYQLRRMKWDEPAATITAAMMGKATCQLHPGTKTWEGDEMVENHVASTLKLYDDDQSKRHTNRPTFWNEPSPTIIFGGGTGGARPHPHPNAPLEGDYTAMHKPLLDSLEALPPNGLTTVELFAGGGLMHLGLDHAGITTVWANDFEKTACEAFGSNFPGVPIVCGDITKINIDLIPNSDLISGGPPCQDFSVAGKGAGEEGERGKLVWTYLAIIERKQPKAFIFENVKGLIQKKHRATFDALLQEFERIGYNVSWKLINAWDYGVAQKRERVFIVGIRKDLGFKFEFPVSEYETTGYHPVIRDAIGDLPEPGEQVNGKCWVPPSEYTYDQANRVQSWDKPSNTIPAHHNSGQPIHPQYANHIEKPVGDYEGFESRTRRRAMEEVSYTVDTRWDINYVHPNKPRRFTVRECLRLQSVPDSYVFPDTMKLSPMYRIVGNGVASRVAYHLGQALSEQLLRAGTTSASTEIAKQHQSE